MLPQSRAEHTPLQKGRRKRGRLNPTDRELIRQNTAPRINFVFVAAFFVVVGIGVLVGVALLGVFVGFSFTHEEGQAYESLVVIGNTMARATNASQQIVLALPPVNLTNITSQSLPQTDEEWIELTRSLTHTGKRALNIVNRAEETDLLGKMAAFTDTAVRTVINPHFARYVQQGVDHLYWVMDMLQSEDAAVIARAIRRSVELYTDESPRGVAERSRMTRGLVEGKDELIGAVSEVREVLAQIKKQKMVEHVSDLLKQARANDVVGKAVHLYEEAEAAEESFDEWVRPLMRVLLNGLADMRHGDKEAK